MTGARLYGGRAFGGRRNVLDGGPGRLRRMGAELSGREWWHMVAMFGFIVALNAAGWGIYLLVVMPHHFDYRGEGASPRDAFRRLRRGRPRGPTAVARADVPVLRPSCIGNARG